MQVQDKLSWDTLSWCDSSDIENVILMECLLSFMLSTIMMQGTMVGGVKSDQTFQIFFSTQTNNNSLQFPVVSTEIYLIMFNLISLEATMTFIVNMIHKSNFIIDI